MELTTAINLIQEGVERTSGSQRWADLGAGTGLFTRALASRLVAGSHIVAIDKNVHAPNAMAWNFSNVTLEITATDFESLDWAGNLDGILMSNSLHFVRDQLNFLTKVREKLAPKGRMIIVEYDLSGANTWVPFPLDFERLTRVATKAGFGVSTRLTETPSMFQHGSIYSALLR